MMAAVSANMAISGVENPVTAVLLNFRGYDTLLEIGVLLLAAVAVLAVVPPPAPHPAPVASSMALVLVRWLMPFVLLVGGYLLWVGKYAPGGAFQAGAVLAGGGVVLTTVAVRVNPAFTNAVLPAMAMGLLTFLLVALATMAMGGNYLQYPLALAGTLILLIEAAATISIAAVLTVLFVGGVPTDGTAGLDGNHRTVVLERSAAKK
jgi:multisubunit Na+/H+ antiporter MnhB subunit